MLKVLHFYKTYYPDSYGGIEQVIFQLCEGAPTYGIDATVLALSPRGHGALMQLGQHHTAYSAVNFEFASTPFSFGAIARFRQLAAQADVVHFHFPYPFMDMVHFLAANTKPTVVSYHSDIVKQKFILRMYTPLMRHFFGDVDRIVASSPNYVATSPVLQRYQSKVSVIPFGLDRASYPPQDKAREAQWRSRFDERFFLFIGAFRYYKGLDTLVEAARGAPYPIVLIGVGPMEAELKKRCAELGLKNMHFLGALPDVDKAALLESCYGVVFPSHLRSEAFGITLLEGAMYGKPLISCEIGTGTTYVNVHRQTGLVVPPASPAELADAMRQLWQDSALARSYGEQARERFNALFTSTRMVSSYADIYRELAGHD
ncbi:glycosyltransferase [Sodalis glossinidius str. 'morsitans']|nr:glycosyltransferase family 4 protein [Sodalis glossinidius]BAE74396.1 glycosyltransferase [Sodalis glossinidius str. 'morsitans']